MTEQGYIQAGHFKAPKCRFRFGLRAEGRGVRAQGVGGPAAEGPVKHRTLFHCARLLWGPSRHLGIQTDAPECLLVGQEELSGCDSGLRRTDAAPKCRGGHGPSASRSLTSPVSDIRQQAGILAQLLGRGSQKDGGHPWSSVDPPESKPAEAAVHPTRGSLTLG